MNEIRIKMLEVDLSNRTHRVVDVTEDCRNYVGGRGLANKLIWDLVPAGSDPLGPANILHVGVGPVTGLMGTKTVLSSISPLTNWVNRSATSGYFGEEVVKAGYNAGILIKGKAEKPCYLYVYNDTVEIRDAAELWGKWKLDTENTIRDRLNKATGEIFGVLCIGPAGENMVRFANVSTEFVHSASKRGCGAVMGSKNLKAIAVRGTKGFQLADHGKVWDLMKKYASHPVTVTSKLHMSRYGLSGSPIELLRFAGEGIKNNHLGWDTIAEKSDHHAHQLKYHMWTDGCPGCAAACFLPFFKNTGHGAFGGDMRHDDLGGFNANIMLGYDEMAEMNGLVDELGLDSEEAGSLVAWAMDLYEHGIISKADLGGIDLKWGDLNATMELLKKIAYKQDKAPAALAEGYRRAYQVFGEESKWYAFEVHGQGTPTYDVRNKETGAALDFGTSHVGARCATRWLMTITLESATGCNFPFFNLGMIHGSQEEAMRLYLNAGCGWELSPGDMKDIIARNYYFNRAVSLREGYHPARDDYLMPRAFDEPITDKYGKTWVWDRNEWEKAKRNYYVDTLALTPEGLPPRRRLEELGLGFVIPVLETLSAVG